MSRLPANSRKTRSRTLWQHQFVHQRTMLFALPLVSPTPTAPSGAVLGSRLTLWLGLPRNDRKGCTSVAVGRISYVHNLSLSLGRRIKICLFHGWSRSSANLPSLKSQSERLSSAGFTFSGETRMMTRCCLASSSPAAFIRRPVGGGHGGRARQQGSVGPLSSDLLGAIFGFPPLSTPLPLSFELRR